MRFNPAAFASIRRSKGLSIADVARRTQDVAAKHEHTRPLDRSTISNLEHGRRPASPAAIVTLAQALEVAPYALCGPEDPAAAMRQIVQQLGLTAADLFDEEVPV